MRRPTSSAAFLFLLATVSAGCAVAPVKPDGTPETVPVDELLRRGARTMWIAAHPDDELFAGALLARSSLVHGNPTFLLVLTHGDGGECGAAEGCGPSLGKFREKELQQAAAYYRAGLEHRWFFNAPLPVSSFPSPEELLARWNRQGDPLGVVTAAIRRFKPDLILTFEPTHGATGHPEHQVAARLATAGVRQAADPRLSLPNLPPHRVGRLYYLLARYWPLRLVGKADPGPVTEQWDAEQPCGDGKTCLERMLRGIDFHRSQVRDMDKVRRFRGAFRTVSLRQVDALRMK